MKPYIILIIFAAAIIISCDRGLSPEQETSQFTGVSGTIYFQNWPPPDSLFDIRLVLFPVFPADSSIMDDIIAGRATVYPGLSDDNRLPLNVDSLNYQVQLEAGTYEYFAVAHQYGSNVFSDWQVVGHYDTTGQDLLPTAIYVEEGQLLEGITIFADFDSVLVRP